MHVHDHTDWPSALVSITLTICLIAGGAVGLAGMYFFVIALSEGEAVQTLLAAL